jgi:hypothetical protein
MRRFASPTRPRPRGVNQGTSNMDSTKQESRDDLAFLTRPERVQQISKKFNESYDALLKGDFTRRGEDGELIRTPRPELPSKYLVRPKKPAFRSSNTDAFADDDFAAFTRGTSRDYIEKKEGDRRRDTASTFDGWKALGLNTDGNDDTKRLSDQTVTYEEEPSGDRVRDQQEMQSGRRPSVTDLEDKHFHAAHHIEAQQKLMEERAEQQKIEDLRRLNGIYPGHIGLREKDIASIIAHHREKERLRREAEHGEGDDDNDEDGREEHEKVVVGHYSARQLHQMQMRAEQGLALDVDLSAASTGGGGPSNATLEVSQTLRALHLSEAAPYSKPEPKPEPKPETKGKGKSQSQSPSINVTAATPRPASIAEFDKTNVPGPEQHSKSFLAERLASNSEIRFPGPNADMDKLQVRSTEFSSVKAKAIEDARQMQAHVIEECTKAGKDPPPYGLVELIGKGSFGRVYMG